MAKANTTAASQTDVGIAAHEVSYWTEERA